MGAAPCDEDGGRRLNIKTNRNVPFRIYSKTGNNEVRKMFEAPTFHCLRKNLLKFHEILINSLKGCRLDCADRADGQRTQSQNIIHIFQQVVKT